MNYRYILLITALAGLLLTACGSATNGEAVTNQDLQIVVLGPSATEVVSALGFSNNIIATDVHSVDIHGIDPSLAIFDMFNMDIETLLSLAPSTILAVNMFAGGISPLSIIYDMDIDIVYVYSSNSIIEIYDTILKIAYTLDAQTQGQQLAYNMMSEINEISSIAQNLEPISVYFEISSAPSMWSFGSGTFLNELIELAGGYNIFSELEGWIAVSDEFILEANPEFIFTNEDFLPSHIEEIAQRPGWDVLYAVYNRNIYQIDVNASSRPSHNIVLALRQMANAMHPQYFEGTN